MPLLWISFAFLAGLVLSGSLSAAEQNLPTATWLTLAVAGLLPILAARLPFLKPLRRLSARHPKLKLPPMLLVSIVVFGGAYYVLAKPALPPDHIAALNDQGAFKVTGVIIESPDLRDQSTQLRVAVETAAAVQDGSTGPARPVHGDLMVMLPGRTNWQYGDRVELEGKPVTPPENEGFSYRDYLARQDIYSYLAFPRTHLIAHGAGSPILAAIYRLREWAYHEVYHLFPAPEAPLLAGILLGIESDLPPGLERAFQNTGTAHIIAISGFNIAILATLFSSIFRRIFSHWWALAVSVLAITGYTLLVGAGASVVRAAVMGSLGLLGAQLGRRSVGWAGLNTLAFTALLMCLPNPDLLWDASFQLSFAATLGLILYASPLQEKFMAFAEHRLSTTTAQRLAGPVGEYLLVTLAAQFTTLPVIIYHFQRLSISSLLANPLVLPPQPLVMILSGLAVIAGLVFDPLAHLLAWLAWPLSAYSIRMVEALSNLPGGVLVLGPTSMGTAALLGGVALLPAFIQVSGGQIRQYLVKWLTPGALIMVTALLSAFLWRMVYSAPDGQLHLVLFEQDGQAAVLIRDPDGQALLINGGPSANRLSSALGRWLPPLGHQLDGLVITQSQPEALESLSAVLERFPVKQAWWAIEPPDNRSGRALIQVLEEQDVTSTGLPPGGGLSLGNGTSLTVLHDGENGSAIQIEWKHFRMLLPDGVAPSTLRDEMQPGLLLITAQDLAEISPSAFQDLAPRTVIVTALENPIEPLPEHWIRLPRWGWLAIDTDGQQMWLRQGR